MKIDNFDVSEVVYELGGQTKVAQICGITQAAVFNWTVRGMPLSWYMYLKKEFPNLKAWNQKEINQQQAAKDLPNA